MDIIKKTRASNLHNVKNLVTGVESIISSVIIDSFPSAWDTAPVDAAILERLHSLFNGRKIRFPGGQISSSWKVFRATEAPEKTFCSIAFIYNIIHGDGQNTAGAAFFDSHCRDNDKNTFSSIKKDHLRKINTQAPHSCLLLYDYSPISGMAFPSYPESIVGNSPVNWNNWLPVTTAAVVQSGPALASGSKTTSLYRSSVPFSYQLCHRHLFGLDLDYGKTALEIASGTREDKGMARYLVTVSLIHGSNEPQVPDEINRGIYQELL